MSVILSSMLLVFGSYIAQPEWFENGPYEYYKEYDSLAECQIATHGIDDICVGDSPSKQFIKVLNVKTDTTYQDKLDWVECDYWAGCYYGKRSEQ
jgi:hypothetical protein